MTRGGFSSWAVRVSMPSRSRARSDSVSTLAGTPRSGTASSENRRGPSRRQTMILVVHLSPTRIGSGSVRRFMNMSGSSGSAMAPWLRTLSLRKPGDERADRRAGRPSPDRDRHRHGAGRRVRRPAVRGPGLPGGGAGVHPRTCGGARAAAGVGARLGGPGPAAHDPGPRCSGHGPLPLRRHSCAAGRRVLLCGPWPPRWWRRSSRPTTTAPWWRSPRPDAKPAQSTGSPEWPSRPAPVGRGTPCGRSPGA